MTGSENSRDSRGGGSTSSLHQKIIAQENLFAAWREFQNGKTTKTDVLAFAENFEEQLFSLADDLSNHNYIHGTYKAFTVCDPKRRNIHKACVRDRVLHHAVHRILEPEFDKAFIYDSYSSRKGKGVHVARERFQKFAMKISRNHTKTVWVLKCDIRKFFDSVDHTILLKEIGNAVHSENLMSLLREIISSYESHPGRGIPLGNLTSQLFSNVYMNEFDQFIKRKLQVKYYVRYADDFVFLSADKEYLQGLIPILSEFLKQKLKLEMHPQKLTIEPWHRGIDFLGAVLFPWHEILRTKTRKRLLQRVDQSVVLYKQDLIEYEKLRAMVASYMGVISHVKSRKLKKQIIKRLSK